MSVWSAFHSAQSFSYRHDIPYSHHLRPRVLLLHRLMRRRSLPQPQRTSDPPLLRIHRHQQEQRLLSIPTRHRLCELELGGRRSKARLDRGGWMAGWRQESPYGSSTYRSSCQLADRQGRRIGDESSSQVVSFIVGPRSIPLIVCDLSQGKTRAPVNLPPPKSNSLMPLLVGSSPSPPNSTRFPGRAWLFSHRMRMPVSRSLWDGTMSRISRC